MARRRLLSDAEIAARLEEVPTWTRVGSAITRSWEFEDFPEALAFIKKVGALAEAMNHHPDIVNSWNKVTLTLPTHHRGGPRELAFRLAQKALALYLRPSGAF